MSGGENRAPLETAEVVARKIGESIGSVLPPGWCFALILASIGEGGYTTWISSIKREGTIRLLREMADKLERGEPNV
jgi:hypothetical protein